MIKNYNGNINELQSKDWDCMFTLEELVEFNKARCILDINYKRHSVDNAYGGYLVYFRNPNKPNDCIEVGVTDDGFTYIGDSSIPMCDRDSSCIEIDVKTAFSIMIEYVNMMCQVANYERAIFKYIDNSCINITHEYNYDKSKLDTKKLYYSLGDKYHG